MDCLFESIKTKFNEHINQENKQQFLKDVLNSSNVYFLMCLPDDFLQEFANLDDESIQKFVKFFEFIENCEQMNIFVGKVLNIICNKIVEKNDTTKFKFDNIISRNVKYMTLETCKKYLTLYNVNIASIAEHHKYVDIYNEHINDDNASTQIKIIFAKFEKDTIMDHTMDFFNVINETIFRHVITHVTTLVTDRYNLQAVMTSKYLTLDDLKLISKKQSNKISKTFFEAAQVPQSIMTALNDIFVNWLIEENKLNFTVQNLGYLVSLSENAKHKQRVIKLLYNMSNLMFNETNFVHTSKIITNVIQHMEIQEIINFSQNLLNMSNVFELYSTLVPPLVALSKIPNYTLNDLIKVISDTKLNEKHHKHAFDYIFFPPIIEKYLDEQDLQTCLKNITVPLRKVIVDQIVTQYKKITKMTLLKLNNIFPIIVKKIYSQYLSQRLPKLVVQKIDMNSLSLSNEEILDMCLIKEDYECGICYLHQISTLCKTCGHGLCTSCETTINKNTCSFCMEEYAYVTIRS